jgi:hypothetical protein
LSGVWFLLPIIDIGDGATITRSMIRRRHSPIAAQLDWCEAEGVTSSPIAAAGL